MRFIAPLLIIGSLLLPASALAHGGTSHRKESSKLPRMQLFTEGANLDAQAIVSGGNPAIAIAARGASLRVAFRRTKQGMRVYQLIGGRKLFLRKATGNMGSGLTDGLRLTLSQNGKIVQQRTQNWCPNNTQPLTDNDLSPTIPDLTVGCGATISRYIEAGIDRDWVNIPFYNGANSLFSAMINPEEDASLQQGDLTVPEPGNYQLKISFDPNRLLHLDRKSKLTRTFNLQVSQELYDSIKARMENPDGQLIQTSATRGILPDLQALPATGLSIWPAENQETLSFSATVWNASKGRLVVSGRRQRSSSNSMRAYQTVTDINGRAVRTFKIGRLVWNNQDGHNHWHYDGLARYRILDENNKPVATSGKIGFCFVNTTPIDTRYFPSYAPNSQNYGNLGCGYRWSLGVSMEMDGGWGDMYGQTLPGQAFDITGLKNGKYTLEVKANAGPYAHIRETRVDNNIAKRRFEILGEPGERYAQAAEWSGDPSYNDPAAMP